MPKAVLVLPLLAIALFFVGSAASAGNSYTVTTAADTNANPTCDPRSPCSLRDAITAANASSGADTIQFDLQNGGVQTITLASALPAITDPVTIDGTTEPGISSSPFGVAIDGGGVLGQSGQVTTSGVQGLVLDTGSDHSKIRGLVFGNFEIAGQNDAAIQVDSNGNAIVGDSIGVEADGTTAAPNGAGIVVTGDSNTIGGSTAADRNVVVNAFGNASGDAGGDGILIQGNGANITPTGNTILGNYVGVLGDGTTVAGNNDTDIQVVDAQNTVIGGPDAADGNVLAGDGIPDAIFLGDFGNTSGSGTTVQHNLIGLEADGSASLYSVKRSGNAMDVNDHGSNTIADNTIANMYDGIDICGSPGNSVERNVIGSNTASPGGPDFGLADDGIWVGNGCGESGSSTGNVIGGAPGDGNVVVGSQLDDLAFDAANQNTASYNTFRGTKGGAAVDISGNGNTLLSNAISGGQTNTQNESFPIPGNGVEVDGGTGNTISQNSIHGDAELGIALQSSRTPAPLPNDAGDGDTGPNNQQNYPVLTSGPGPAGTFFTGGSLTVNGTIDTASSGSPYQVEIFQSTACNASGNGEGATYLGTIPVITSGGVQGFSGTVPALTNGNVITATATAPAPDGSTSEFSACVTASGSAPSTFIVNTNADSNDGGCTDELCSLRDALTAAANGGTIKFDIPGSGVQTIFTTAALPPVTAPVTIDGTTQPGYSGTPLIYVTGDQCPECGGFGGLTVSGGSGSVIKGLAIGGFPSDPGIELSGSSSDTTVTDTYVGIKPNGGQDSNGGGGIAIENSDGNTIDGVIAAGNTGEGGPAQIRISGSDATGNVVRASRIGIGPGPSQIYDNPGDTDTGVEINNGAFGNTIGASASDLAGGNVIALIGTGVVLDGGGSGNVVAGNRIGLDDTGASTQMRHAVTITNTPGTTVGGTGDPKLGNVIGGVTGAVLASAISVDGGAGPVDGTVISGNFLGVDRSANDTQPNTLGIDISGATGVTIGPGNTIANSIGSSSKPADGVLVEPGADEVQITQNSIYANGGKGIDLSGAGANDGIAAPTISSVVGNTASGSVTGPANDTFTIELFGNATCADAANGAGRDFLGSSVPVTIGAGGTAQWTATLTGLGSDEGVTATATDATPDTSEFSGCVVAQEATDNIVVNTANDHDDGACTASDCTLREAINEANAAGGGKITFQISGGWPQTITLSGSESNLPPITGPVTIDGTTELGTPLDTPGVTIIANAGFDGVDLAPGSGGSTIRGLAIGGVNDEAGHGAPIRVESDNDTIVGNYVGVSADGTSGDSSMLGIVVTGNNDTIGGDSSAGDGNVIVGSGTGILVQPAQGSESSPDGNVIQGNQLGIYPPGAELPGGQDATGIDIEDATNTLVGNHDDTNQLPDVQAHPELGNVISDSPFDAIEIGGSTGTKVVGNFIGVERGGHNDTIGSNNGVDLVSSSGNTIGPGNVIAHAANDGVLVDPNSNGDRIAANSIYDSGNLGIDLSGGGGGNHGIAAPVVTSTAGDTVSGTVSGSDPVFLEVFVNPSCNAPYASGAGKTYVTFEATAPGTFDIPVSGLTPGEGVTVTATDESTTDTSEFSNCSVSGPLTGNGKIAFDNGFGTFISVVGADGSGLTQLQGNSSSWPRWSPDGSEITFMSSRTGTSQVYVMDADGTNVTQVTNSSTGAEFPSFSPDGRRILYDEAGAIMEISATAVDGSPSSTQLVANNTSAGLAEAPAESPDGKTIAFSGTNGGCGQSGSCNLWLFDLGSQTLTPLTNDSGDLNEFPAWSRDGFRIYFEHGDLQGGSFIYSVRWVANTGGAVTTLPVGVYGPAPSPDGTKLAYSNGTGIAISNPDGGGASSLNLSNSVSYFDLAWQPVGAGSGSGGELSAAVSQPVSQHVDLTDAGTADWAVWGYGSSSIALAPNVRKSGGVGISDLSQSPGDGPPRNFGQFSYPTVPFGFDWTDGTSPASASGASAGITAPQVGQGYSFTVPAGTAERTLTVWTSAHYADGTLTAHLSDGSAPDYTDTVQAFQGQFTNTGENVPDVFTIVYRAASAGQHLTVTWTQSADHCGGCDDVVIYAAALLVGGATNASASLTSGQTVGMAGANVLTSDIPLAAFDPQPPGAPPIETHGLQLNNLQLNNLQLNNLQLNNLQLNNLQLNNLQLNNLQLNNLQLNNLQLNNLQLNNLQLNNLQLNNLPLDPSQFPNGWAGVLAGTPLAGQPLQTITLEQVISLSPQPTAFQTSPLTLGDLQAAGTAFGNMTVGSLALIGAQLNNLGSDFQDSIETQLQDWCLSVVTSGDPNNFCGVGGQMGTFSLLELGLAGAPIQGLQLNNLQLNNLQLNNLQLNNLQLNNLSTSASGIAGMQLNNLQLNNLPFGQEGIGDLLVSSLPAAVQNALFDCSNPSNFDCATGTLGDAQVAGAINPDATVGDLDVSTFFQNVSIVRLLQSVLGPDSGYATSADFGDFVGLFIQSADVQWETLAPDLLSLFDASRPTLPMTAVFSVQGTGNPPADVQVQLPAGFDFDPGTATLAENGDPVTPPGDPTITSGSDGLTLTWHFASLDPGVPYTLAFRVFSGTTVGGAQATETVTSGSQSDSSTTSFGVTPSFPGDTSPSTPQALDPTQDAVHLSALPAAGVVDYYTIPMPPAGTRVQVHLTDLPADYDLALYAPQTTSVRTGATASPPLQDGVVPDQPINLQGGSSGSLTPTALEDIPDPGIPVVQVSDNRGMDDEDVGMVSPGGGGVITIAVFGYNGAFSPKAYSLRVTEHSAPPTQTCSARTLPSSAGTTPDSLPVLANLPQNLNTLILVDEKRLGNTYGANAETTALAKLRHLAGSDSTLGVSGVLVPVESITGVQALYNTWDANPCNPDSANAVANAIANYVAQIKQARGSLKYVVFAGGDDEIPFFRLPDLSLIANESGFAGQFGANEYGGSLAAGDLLSDSPYLDTQPTPASGQQLFIPDLVGGRLVETAADIANAVTSFENAKGILKSSTAFVSGYDFVTDSSATIAQELGGILGSKNVRTLPSPLVANPLVPPSWTAANLLAAAFPMGGPAAINDWNGHYDNTRTQAADGTSLISTSQLTGKNAFNGGIFFTMGCHAGFQTTDAVIGTSVLDWPQYFAQHNTGFVGNTGFGIGSTDSIGFDEELMADFAANLDGSLSLGDALVQAEDQYYLSRVAFSNYDEKTLGETELYGLPMYGVGHAPASLVAALSLPSGPVKGTSASTSPNQGTLSNFPGTSVQSANFAATPHFVGPVIGKDGQYYTNDGLVQAPNYRPLQPYVSLPAGRGGLVAHGAVIDSLTSSDDVGTGPAGFVPDNVRPTLDKSKNEPPPTFTDETWPEKIPTLVSLGPNQNLNLITGQFFTQTSNNSGVERKWTQINGRVTYSSSLDFTPPTIDSIDAFQTGQGTVVFTGRFSDLDQNGSPGTVKFAQVVFDDGAGTWNPVQLTKGTSGDWTGVAQFSGTNLQYFVEACDDAGNCGYSSNKGRYFDAQALPPATTGAITLTPRGTSGTNPWFTGQVGVDATSTAGDVTVSVDGGPFESPGLVAITGDGAHTVEARDAAGDTATTVVLIDNTPPTKPAIQGITDGGAYAVGGVPTNVSCTATDTTSGLASCNVPTPGTNTGGHTLTATATDNAGNTSQSTVSYTVVLPTPPTITSANTTTFTSGTAGSFTVSTTGNPVPALTNANFGDCVKSSLPAAITFTDNHDGTATIASTTATITPGSYILCLGAANGTSPDAHQKFTLVVNAAAVTFAGITFANTVESGSGKVPNCTTNNPFKTGTNDVNSFPNAICSSDGNAPAPSTFSWQVELAKGTPQSATPVTNTGSPITVTVTKITTNGTNKGQPPSLVGGGVGLSATIPTGSATTSTSFKVQNFGNNDWIQVTVTVNLGAGKVYTLEIQVH